MKVRGIVYTSNTGYTADYAKLLGSKINLPVYTIEEAGTFLAKGAPVIYMGWLMAGTVKDYQKAAKRYTIVAVCGVGLGETGSQTEEVRKGSAIPPQIPLFTLQGGMDHGKLRGVYKSIIKVLTRAMAGKKNRSEGEERMLALLQCGGNYVCEENLAEVMAWYQEQLAL